MWRHPWLALAGGFGGLLLIMAAAEFGALLMIGSLQTSDARVEQRFLERSRTLERIRSRATANWPVFSKSSGLD